MVYPKWRNKGVGTLLNKFRCELAKQDGFGLMLCTDVVDNTAQKFVLFRNGWNSLLQFNNPRTGHMVNLSVKDLNE